MAIALKSGILNLLEIPGPVQANNGIAFSILLMDNFNCIITNIFMVKMGAIEIVVCSKYWQIALPL